MEVRWGLIPDMGITQSLPRLVGIDVAKELTFTGRIVSGTEARDLRLVTHTAEDPTSYARALAQEIAGRPTKAVRSGKTLFNEAWHADADSALSLEAELQRVLLTDLKARKAEQAQTS